MGITINQRDKQIFGYIMQEFISTGEPVGSRVVSRRYDLDISPATIRNIMSDLEELGFLLQPHISAGRVPTKEGIHYYLNEIIKMKALPKEDKSIISRQISKNTGGLKETLHEASMLLSEISGNTSVVILPKISTFTFKRIELVKLETNRILVILISKSGLVYNHVVQGDDISQDDLTKYSNFLNEKYSGLSIKKMRESLSKEMESEKAQFDSLVKKAVHIGMMALDNVEDAQDVVIEGKDIVFNCPELSDIEKLREIVRAFEDKGRMLRILNQVFVGTGVKIFIGEEMGNIGINDFSMVASGYFHGDTPVGSLGVIGPMRMNYKRIIPLVEYMAKLLSSIIEEI
jgi:heat-inducible transcriptional repressor